MSCAHVKQVGGDLAVCALAQTQAIIAGLMPEVLTALTGTAADWSAEVTALELQGADIAICVIRQAFAQLGTASVSKGAALSPAEIIARDRADVYLRTHGGV